MITQTKLTPTAAAAPTEITLPEPELSGVQWVNRWQGSKSLNDLEPEFQNSLNHFISALRSAGAMVTIAATYRPPERAWLMHWSYLLSKEQVKAAKIPVQRGINIKWDHGQEEKSISAAKEMADEFEISHLGVPPALASRHTQRKAVDMNISWSGILTIQDANGKSIKIQTAPQTGMNATLQEIGKSYGVIKFLKGLKDKPHWSTDGR